MKKGITGRVGTFTEKSVIFTGFFYTPVRTIVLKE